MAELTLDNARELLESWSRATSWGRRNLAAKLEVTSFEEKSGYTVRLESHVEARRMKDQQRPYLGRPLDGGDDLAADDDDNPIEPSLARTLAAAEPTPPADFVADIQAFVVPHTDVVRPCSRCETTGRERCAPCTGGGMTTCTQCWGHGEAGTGDESRTCHLCRGSGEISCGHCQGVGGVECTACLGHRKLVHSDQVIIHYQNRLEEKVLTGTAIPVGLIADASSKTAYREEAHRLEPVAGHGGGGPFRGMAARVNGRVNAAANELIEGERLAPDEKIIKQRLTVESLPVYELTYRWGGDLRRCWFYGHDQAIHAPGYPISRMRVAGTAVAAAALLAIGAGRVMGLL